MKNLKKLCLTLILAFAFVMPSFAFAETIEVDTEEKLAEVFKDGGTAKLTEDLTLTGDINLNDGKTVTLDLNEHNILTQDNRIKVVKGYLTITGKGVINGTMEKAAPVVIYGSEDENDSNYSSLTVDENVTLEGEFATYISWDAYGVTVNLKGTFKSIGDDQEAAFTISGNNKGIKNCPVINISSTAKFISDGYGLYAAGYAIWNIDAATIRGVKGGIGIKAGKINLKNTKVIATGEDTIGTYNNNGMNATGAAIAIESNNSYAGNIEITIDGGTYNSSKGSAIYHYLAKKTSDEVVESKIITPTKIKSGTFDGKINLITYKDLEASGGTFDDSEIYKYVSDDFKPVKVVDGSMTFYTVVAIEKGELEVATPEVVVSEEVDKDIAEELTNATFKDPVTGLKEAIDVDKLDGIGEEMVYITVSSDVKSYDKEKSVLVLDLKPLYKSGRSYELIPNEAINGKVKVKVAVPNEITDTHAKVVHKNDEKIIDTKEYEVKEEKGQKYVEIETESFSTFEFSFYTPQSPVTTTTDTTEKVENPNTLDGILLYTSITLISLSLLGLAALVLKKKMN